MRSLVLCLQRLITLYIFVLDAQRAIFGWHSGRYSWVLLSVIDYRNSVKPAFHFFAFPAQSIASFIVDRRTINRTGKISSRTGAGDDCESRVNSRRAATCPSSYAGCATTVSTGSVT